MLIRQSIKKVGEETVKRLGDKTSDRTLKDHRSFYATQLTLEGGTSRQLTDFMKINGIGLKKWKTKHPVCFLVVRHPVFLAMRKFQSRYHP